MGRVVQGYFCGKMYDEVPALSGLPAEAAEEIVLNAALNSKVRARLAAPAGRAVRRCACPPGGARSLPAGLATRRRLLARRPMLITTPTILRHASLRLLSTRPFWSTLRLGSSISWATAPSARCW